MPSAREEREEESERRDGEDYFIPREEIEDFVVSLLESSGFSVYTHHQVSTNDEGVALGQLAIARHRQKLSGAGSAVQPSDHYKRKKGA